MKTYQILESSVIDGRHDRPDFPDVTMLMTILQHKSYSSEEDAKADGLIPSKWKISIRIEYEKID